MEDSTIEVGDVVRLKSGGPAMTVEDIGDFNWGAKGNQALCKWFEGAQLREQTFELTSLQKV